MNSSGPRQRGGGRVSPIISRTVASMVADMASRARSLGSVPKGSSISAESASSAKKV